MLLSDFLRQKQLREKGLIQAYSSGRILHHEGETTATGRENVVAGALGCMVT